MFYSHDILRSREGGIATVWLVATLGSKTNHKKINRKSILEVDVKKTCGFIVEPQAPIALRLQGNLLYGVVRVYSRQYAYVLSDAETIKANIRTLLKAVKTSELDPNAGRVRREQLMIQDDPAFLPDLGLPGLDIDLSGLDISDDSSRLSSILSQRSQVSSVSSGHEPEDSMLGPVIPSSTFGGSGIIGGFQLHSDAGNSARASLAVGHLLDNDENFNISPGFSFDDDGNMHESSLMHESGNLIGNVRAGIDTAAGARVRQEVTEGMRMDHREQNFNDDQLLPDATAFPSIASEVAAQIARTGDSSETGKERDSESSYGAPLQRKRRVAKVLPVDQRQELRNADLAVWKENYTANMAEAVSFQAHRKVTATAKKNAAHWIMGLGVAGVGAGVGVEKIQSPLHVFSGLALLEALRGTSTSAGRKRPRGDDEHNSDLEGRNVRPREQDGDQFGRGNDNILQDDDAALVLTDEGIEVGRHAQPSLEDPSMPWNVSASSRQASLIRGRGFQSSIGDFPTSAGAPSGSIGGPHSIAHEHRASRVTSASPLRSRGNQRYSSIELPTHDEADSIPSEAIPDPQALENFELYGPGAGVATQTAAGSQWVKSALTHEADNFLDFVKAEIKARKSPLQDESGLSIKVETAILFEDLLPPLQHSKTVGAQGFYHVLALATAGQLDVKQHNEAEFEGFGPISLRVPTNF